MTYIPEKNIRLTPANEQLVNERRGVISSTPIVANYISQLRDDTAAAGTGFVSGSFSQIIVGTGVTAGSTARLVTKKRAQYYSGFSMEAGCGIIVPVAPVGTQKARWGYFDSQNGVGSGVDVTGSFVFRRKQGLDTVVYQSDWNIDKLNGSGSSGLSLSLQDGAISSQEFTWYGLGVIGYSFRVVNSASYQRTDVLAHRLLITGSLSFDIPNQPISCEVENGSGGGSFQINVGGRQVTVFGSPAPFARNIATYISGVSITTTSPSPVISLRKKSIFGVLNNSVPVAVESVSFLSDQPIVYQILYGLSGSVSGAFSAPIETHMSESAIEIQVTGSSLTGTQLLLDGGFVGGSNAPGGRQFVSEAADTELALGETDVIQLRIGKATNNNASVSVILRWKELW